MDGLLISFFRPFFVCLSLRVLVGIQNQGVGARGSYPGLGSTIL